MGEVFQLQERPRTDGLQRETERTGPYQSSSFNNYGPGDLFNAPGGKLSSSNGNYSNHFPGANFHGNVSFGTGGPSDPLQDCLKSLAFPEMHSRSNDIGPPAEGTCRWLLRHKTYTNWADGHRGLLWIKGKPGSGKSTLLKYALGECLNLYGKEVIIVSFFFHGRGHKLQRTPLGLFRSLLHQLLKRDPGALPDLIDYFKEKRKTEGEPGEKWQWHLQPLQGFLESSVSRILKNVPVILFIDALDECGQQPAVELIGYLKGLLSGLPPTTSRFGICFSCRHYPILHLDGGSTIELDTVNTQDIVTFVQAECSARSLDADVGRSILSRAQGSFLWTHLVLKKVHLLHLQGESTGEIKTEVKRIPQDLNDLYDELIKDVEHSSSALRLMQWICFSMRPLTTDELRWAMAVDSECTHKSLDECRRSDDFITDDKIDRRITTLSCGLAEIVQSGDAHVVQFIHHSVKDFFVNKGLSGLDGRPSTRLSTALIAHHRLSRTCIRYLAMEEIGRAASHERYRLRSKFPFLHYATTSWVAHTMHIDGSVLQEDLLEYFAWPSNTLVERWVGVYGILEPFSHDCPPEGTSLVHIMSRYGVAGALWAILKRADQVRINIDAKDSHGRTPLLWAAEEGHKAVVRLLLDRGANIEAANKKGQTPLLWAAEHGHVAVVRLLLDQDANIEAADKLEGRTPLWWAAELGHEAVVRLLLDRGANIEAANKKGQTPLLWAAEHGHEAVVRVLLNGGAHTEAADKWGRTPLSRAAEHGHEAVVRLLLNGGAHTEAADKMAGQTPLSRAAENGHEAVVRLLLDRGANIEAADNWEHRTPLAWAAGAWAAGRGHVAVVRLLLDRGAHAEAADKWGRTPLWWAYGHEAAVRLLQFHGSQPSSTTSP